MRTSGQVRFQLRLQKIVFTLLLIGLTIIIAWIGQQHPYRWDLTAGARNTISDTSIEILEAMTDEVLINVYVQDDEMTREAVSEILERYQRFKPDLRYSLINPDIDIVLAERDNISQYGQVVIRYRNRQETISSLSENVLSSTLLKLSQEDSRVVTYISGHGERDPGSIDNRGYSQLTEQLQNNGYEIRTHHLLKGPIPEDTDVLVMAAPADPLPDGELAHIIGYIAEGRNLLWLMDPGEIYSMQTLADQLGIQFHLGVVVDNNQDLRKTLQIEHPAFIPVLEYFPHEITTNIQYNTIFPTSRGVEHEPRDDWMGSPLFQSFAQSWSESSGLTGRIIFNSDDGDIAGPIPLGVALTRMTGEDTEQRVVAIGDSDFLSNAYVGAGANLTLGLNVFNWLIDDGQMIAIEPKGAPDTRLEMSDAMIAMVGIGFFVIIPVVLVITGFAIWIRRRRA